MKEFKKWWDNIGSAIKPKDGEDYEMHAKRVCEEFALYLDKLKIGDEYA